ncbi:MAG: hypothetical protein WCC10_07685 [Tumebacillaceae bacterium]
MEERKQSTDIWIGIGMTALLHVLAVIILFATNNEAALLVIGGTQLVYILPVSFIYAIKKRSAIAAGIWIGAGITFLLNAACFGIGIGIFMFGSH